MSDTIVRLLAPYPGRLEYTLRVALICALTAFVVELYQTPDAALTVYIVFFFIKPDRAESIALNAVLSALISLIITFVVLVTIFVIDAPLWRLVAMTGISFGLLFLASTSKLRPIGSIIALIVGYALDLLGTVHGGEIATRALLYAWLFVTIPAGVSLIVNLTIAPPPRKLIERTLAERLEIAAHMLREPAEHVEHDFKQCVRRGNEELYAWLKLAAAERTSSAQDLAALKQAAESTVPLLAWVRVVTEERGEPLPAAERLAIAHTLDEMAAIFRDGGYPLDVHLDEPARIAPPTALAGELWSSMQALLDRFAVTPRPLPAQPEPAAKDSGFFVADAFTNPEHVHYALKTTAAAIFCYLLYTLLDWPSIHTCLITCYIVSLTTAAETFEKLTLRIVGCMIGAASGIAAIVFWMPSLTSIGALLGTVFLGTAVSAWVAAGSPRISYAGFQMAFAFLLCVLQGPAPSFDLVTARDRVIGILIGNLVVYLLFTHVWPVSVSRRIDPSIADIMRGLGRMIMAAALTTRRREAAQAQTALAAIEQDLHLTRYEPPNLRPSDAWRELRSRVAQELAALHAPLVLITDERHSHSVPIGRRLESLADEWSPSARLTGPGEEASDAAKDEPATAMGGSRTQHLLQALIHPRLERLAHMLHQGESSERAAEHAAV